MNRETSKFTGWMCQTDHFTEQMWISPWAPTGHGRHLRLAVPDRPSDWAYLEESVRNEPYEPDHFTVTIPRPQTRNGLEILCRLLGIPLDPA